MKRIVFLIGLIAVLGAVFVYGQEKTMTKDENQNALEVAPSYMKNYEEGVNSKEKFVDAVNKILEIKKPAIPHLINFAKDKNKNLWLRSRALELVGQIGDKSAIESLVELINDQDQNIEIRTGSVEALIKLNDPNACCKFLLNMLEDSNSQIRSSATRALGLLKCDEGNRDLIKIIKNDKEDKDVIKNAIIALGNLESREATEEIMKFVDNVDLNLKGSAILALAKIKDPKSLDTLIKIALDANDEYSSYAIEALGEFKDKLAVDTLIKVLQEGDSYRAMIASESLAKIGAKEAAIHIKNKIEELKGTDSFADEKMQEIYKKLNSK